MTEHSKALRNAILRNDYHAFSLKAFEVLHPSSRMEDNWHLEVISLKLQQVLERKVTRLIVNAPPRSLKSFFASVTLPAFALGLDPSRKFVCASYSQDLSGKLSLDCRRLIESDFYREIFPDVQLAKSTENELQSHIGGFRYATSVGGTLTGRGGDDLIIDDPLNANDAYSEISRKGATDWYSRSMASRLDRKTDGTIIVISQRLHPEDLAGYLLAQGGWELLSLPAIAPSDTWFQLRRRSHHWKAGEPLQKIREPLPVLNRLKTELGSAMFSAQYLQEPIPEDGNMLKAAWLCEYEYPPSPHKGDLVVQSWDTAIKATESSNHSVCLTFLVRGSEYYLLHVLREKLEFPELRAQVRVQAAQFRADAILIEDKASGSSLIQYAKRDGVAGVIGVQPEADKKTRMYSQTPRLEAKSLLLPRSASWRPDFLKEYLSFPTGRSDDQIDALSQFLNWESRRESSVFEWDFGDPSEEGAPSIDEILRKLGRR